MKMCHLSVPQALLPQDFHMLSQERGPAAPSTHLLFANVASECNLRAPVSYTYLTLPTIYSV